MASSVGPLLLFTQDAAAPSLPPSLGLGGSPWCPALAQGSLGPAPHPSLPAGGTYLTIPIPAQGASSRENALLWRRLQAPPQGGEREGFGRGGWKSS